MNEPYDWAEEQDWHPASKPVADLPAVRFQMPPVPRRPEPIDLGHGPGCRCPICDDRPPVIIAQPAPPAGAPLLDKVIALVVAFSALVLGSYLLIPLLTLLMVVVVVGVVAVVSALAILLGIVRAVTGYRPERRDDRVKR